MPPEPYTSRNNGFTLPELMVTVLIGIGLMAGMAIMFWKFSQGLEFASGFHTQLQKVERFREDFANYAATYPFPIGQSGSVAEIAEFGFEAQAFANEIGDGWFLVGAVKDSWTGFVVSAQAPYAKYFPTIVPLTSADVAAIRTSGLSAFLASLPASKGKTYRDVLLTRLLATETGGGNVRIDVSYLSNFDVGLTGKNFVLAKSEEGYDTNSVTLRNPAWTTVAWDSRGCFSNVQTVNGRSYSVPLMANLSTAWVETRASIENGSVIYRQSFACKDGVSAPDGAEVVASTACDTNFVWNGGSCAVNSSQNSACAWLPANASWNSVSSIGQAWDGANWIPSATWSYNAVASTSECRFVCNLGYAWDWTTCGLSCDVPATDTYNSRSYAIGTLTKIPHWQTNVRDGYSFFWVPPLDGSLLASFTYSCSNGVATRISASSGSGSCWTNYTFNGDWTSPWCVANTRTFACAAKPAVGTNWNTVSSYSQTWSGSLSNWLPSDTVTAYNATSSTSSCRYVCAWWYGWDGSTCWVTQNGLCWAASWQSTYVQPSTGLCSVWTPSPVTGTGPWNWTCLWTYAGSNAWCSGLLRQDGVCGSANGTSASVAPTANLCAVWTASYVSGTWPWTWTCWGMNGGNASATCSVNKYSYMCLCNNDSNNTVWYTDTNLTWGWCSAYSTCWNCWYGGGVHWMCYAQ